MKKNKVIINKVKWFNNRLAKLALIDNKNHKAKFIPGASLFLEGREKELRIVLIPKISKS